MPKYVIEREIPGVGKMTAEERQGGAVKSNAIIDELGTHIQWVHSYLTPDKIYCIYLAPNKEIIQQHADLSGFPANRIEEVQGLIDPTTAQ
ncbi:MAG: DUF4242 domain-containing protein [Pseudomonadota bacterium]